MGLIIDSKRDYCKCNIFDESWQKSTIDLNDGKATLLVKVFHDMLILCVGGKQNYTMMNLFQIAYWHNSPVENIILTTIYNQHRYFIEIKDYVLLLLKIF